MAQSAEGRQPLTPHNRAYLSVFGEFELSRIVYGTREGRKIEYVPLDTRLQLPQSKFSYLLQDWDQSITLEMPFNQVSTTIEKILGLRQSVHSLERCGQHLAEEVPTFWEAQPSPPAEEEGALLVCTADGKGVPMRDETGTTAPQVETIFGWMAQEAAERGRAAQRALILLMDGQESLWNAGMEYLPEQDFEVIEILDLIHAVSYIWQAAHLFHPSGSDRAFKLARKQLRRILSGDVESVIRALRRMAIRRVLKGKRREDLEKICNYFRNNAERMAYDEYLAAGYPIASGVIEGACRTVVNERMERSGMRWVFDGAHAMLGLRSIRLSGLWDDFIKFRIDQEVRRLYPNSAANDDDILLLCAA